MISRALPNEPSPKRAYQLGQALREVIEAWDSDKRVAILASGGLSHQVCDEEFDRVVVEALTKSDIDTLFSLPRDRLNFSPGTPEILNWIAAAGAMKEAPMTLIDYVPCYRSPASTGHGVTFGYWE
jgi:aromatic ring-opening dioxygenase catalytic subunit (LigB family)